MPPGEYQKDTPYGSKTLPIRYQNETSFSSKILPFMVANLNPNNNNIKHYQYNNNKEVEKDVAVAIDFIKLKEEERRKRIKEDFIGLEFKDSFREKLLKDFPLEKIEEKLELLKEKKNIVNPAG